MSGDSAQNPFAQLQDIDTRSLEPFSSVHESGQEDQSMGGLALGLGRWKLIFSMDDVAEIVPIPSLTRVPRVKTWLSGVTNLRGAILSVVDLQSFLSGTAATETPRSRIVVARADEWSYGLVMDEIIGMRHFTAENIVQHPDAVPVELKPYITNVYRSSDETWFGFSTDRLLRDPRFLGAGD